MITRFIEGENLKDNAAELIAGLQHDMSVKGLMVLACDKNGLTKTDYEQILPSDLPVFGGLFPQVIYKNKNYEKGILIIGLLHEPSVNVIENVSNTSVLIDEQLNDNLLEREYETMFVYVDAFSSRIGDIISELFNAYGLEVNFIGGGAGSLDMKQKPCIFTNHGVLQDAVVIAALKNKSSIGVKHGWEELSGPYKVSSSEKNTILMLDNKPAFDIYKEVVERDSGKQIDAGNFFQVAKAYPFGISKFGSEKIVRDPIVSGKNGELICVGEVPQNVFVHILKGKPENLINATREALDTASTDSHNSGITFFIDCISRVLFLEDDFQKEINTVASSGSLLAGALTLGEIANSGSEFLEFFNKTAVVALIEDL